MENKENVIKSKGNSGLRMSRAMTKERHCKNVVKARAKKVTMVRGWDVAMEKVVEILVLGLVKKSVHR
jgi:hypothetical protein